MRSILGIVAGGAMLLSSTAASAEMTRTSAPIDDQEQIAAHPWVPWLVALIAALVIILFITENDGDPESP